MLVHKMSAVNRVQVPQELVDAIIDYLWDEKNTLSACSLVSKSWSPRARRLLFRTLQLFSEAIPQKPYEECPDVEVPDWARFISDFTSMYAVAGLVENLEVFGTALPAEVEDLDVLDEIFFGCDSDGESDPMGVSYVLLPLDTLLSMILPLPNLRRVFLQNLVLKPTPLSLRVEPKGLHSVALERVGVLDGADVLDVFHVLEPEANVSLDVFWRPTEDNQEPALTRTQRGLTAAHWRITAYPDIHPILRRGLLDTPFISHVTSLDIGIRELDELLALSELLRAVGLRLKSLKLNLFHAFWESNLDPNSISLSPKLREAWDREATLASCAGQQLEFLFRVGTTGEPFEVVSRLLSTLPPSILKVTFVIHFVHFILDRVEALPWHLFGPALHNHGSLEKVLFTLSGTGPSGSEEACAQIIGTVISRLPNCEGDLKVVFVSRGPYWGPWEAKE